MTVCGCQLHFNRSVRPHQIFRLVASRLDMQLLTPENVSIDFFMVPAILPKFRLLSISPPPPTTGSVVSSFWPKPARIYWNRSHPIQHFAANFLSPLQGRSNVAGKRTSGISNRFLLRKSINLHHITYSFMFIDLRVLGVRSVSLFETCTRTCMALHVVFEWTKLTSVPPRTCSCTQFLHVFAFFEKNSVWFDSFYSLDNKQKVTACMPASVSFSHTQWAQQLTIIQTNVNL